MLFNRPLAQGYPGIRQTVLSIVALIRRGSELEDIRALSRRITEQARNDLERIVRIFYWVKSHLHYTRDPLDIELVKHPSRMLREIEAGGYARGDCDDYTVLMGSLLEALGIPTRVRIIRTKGNELFNHVFPEVFVRGRWIPLDATLKNSIPGKLYGKPLDQKSFAYGV